MPALNASIARAAWQASRLLGAVIMGALLTVPRTGAAAAPGTPAEAPGKIRAIERAIDAGRSRSQALDRKAKDIARETAQLSRSLVKLGREAQNLERAVENLRQRIASIARRQRAGTERLKREKKRLTQLLANLQRVARNPPEAVLAYASSPADVLRAARLLKAVIPHLEAQAGKLKAELVSLQELREDASRRKTDLAKTATALDTKREQVNRLLARKRALVRTTRAEQKRAQQATHKLAAKARSLRGLLRSIEKDRKRRAAKTFLPAKPMPANPPLVTANARPRLKLRLGVGPVPLISRARGRLAMPVMGKVVTRYGKRRSAGIRTKGVRFATTPGAQVVAPHDGYVVFAGLFRGYGRLLIIDHGEGYHSLLAGLGRIDVAVNQRLLAGEPIGIMAQTGQAKPRLYLELRRKGQPINPLPWLAASPIDKVSG